MKSNGSPIDYVNNLISEKYLAGEIESIPDYVSAKKIKNSVKTAVSEYMNKEMVC